MPELPEVETVKRSLEKHIVGHRITSFVRFRDSLRYQLDSNLALKTENTTITNIRRIAKYLIIDLSNNHSVIFHLGMSGRLTFKANDYQFQKHDHVALILENNNKLVFNDTRRFGMIYVCPSNELKSQKYLQNIGPEPFDKKFNVEYLFSCFKNKRIPIKSAIMDNKIVVGVGNIYASESLFIAAINPLKPAQDLTKTDINNLIKAIIMVLNKAINAGGTTLRDFLSGDNKPGYFKQELNVYGRKNEACNICNTIISKIVQSGRATYFCSGCQK
jgi:formamidopyrimidine-DNA glycosylase